MTQEIQTANQLTPFSAEAMEKLVLHGNLAVLSPQEKVMYYQEVCKRLGLNPLNKPFQIIAFQGKEIMYATKDCTEQLRKLHGVSICGLDKLFQGDLYIVTAMAQDRDGRQDAATGVVSIANLKGDAAANAIMKAETKAKRRVTLSICGLGMLDESETDTIGSYKKIDVTTGETIEVKEKKEEEKPVYNLVEKKKEILSHINSITDLTTLRNYWSSLKNELKKFDGLDIEEITEAKDAQKKQLLTNKTNNEDIPQ